MFLHEEKEEDEKEGVKGAEKSLTTTYRPPLEVILSGCLEQGFRLGASAVIALVSFNARDPADRRLWGLGI